MLACHAIHLEGHVMIMGGGGGGSKVRWDTHSHAMRLEPKERLRGDNVVFLLSLLLIPICLLNTC